MAERWQQWMPFHIDRFRGSPEVQAMHPSARIGYLYLLSSSWQTSDCTVSLDPIDLATESGLGDELWAQHGARILRNFKLVDGRYRNAVVFEEWKKAKKEFEKNHGPKLSPEELSEAKRIAGMAGAKARWQKNGRVPSNRWQTDGKPMANDGLQEQEHIQKQSTKTLASTADAVPAVRGKLVCTLPLNTGDHEVFEADVQEWIPLYPAVDIRQELRTMKGWLLGSPQRRKTKSGIGRFINAWFARAQNESRPGAGNGTTQGNHKPNAAVDRQRITHDAIRDAARRRYGIGVDESDGAGAGFQAQPDATSGNAGCVPPGMGGDSPEIRLDDFQGRTLEGTP